MEKYELLDMKEKQVQDQQIIIDRILEKLKDHYKLNILLRSDLNSVDDLENN